MICLHSQTHEYLAKSILRKKIAKHVGYQISAFHKHNYILIFHAQYELALKVANYFW
jgi:hypothetical protein